MYKTLQPQTASNYGDFSQASEHPDFGGAFRRSYDSWHNYDRAIDIGAFWKDPNTGNNDQKKVLAKVGKKQKTLSLFERRKQQRQNR